ncbi:RNA-binding S4 domain-containing protein [Halocola ammonii]
MIEFHIQGEYIELIKLLKALNLVSSGGEAKSVVEDGLIQVNGEVETRKRRKLKPGDQVEFETHKIALMEQ